MTQEQILEQVNKTTRWGMFSEEGNKSCQSVIRKLVTAIFSDKRWTMEAFQAFSDELLNPMKETHPEIFDTDVLCSVRHYVEKAFDTVGYSGKFYDKYDPYPWS